MKLTFFKTGIRVSAPLKSLVCPLVASAAFQAPAVLEPASPESQGLPSRAVLDWIDACERTFDGVHDGILHGFVIVRHGRTVAEGTWRPFDTLDRPHMLYSHSKSFTSSAVGFLVDEGKLDLDDRVVDLLPEAVPSDVPENARQLRVRDLLTMNIGTERHHTIGRVTSSWMRAFFDKPFEKRPGTSFRYDSDATYMLAAIVERKTGRKIGDFLKERMFDKIGIEKAWTTVSPEGIACGGWGWNMTTRELARFGQLYLQRGAWNGEQLLSPDWVALATARHTWSGWINIGAKRIGEGTDWEQGYGFQFWRCTHGAYRADGASGQVTVVLPEQDAVVSVHAGLSNMQKELDLVWNILLPAMKDTPLAEDADASARLNRRLEGLSVKPLAADGADKPQTGLLGRTIRLKDNKRGIRSVRFEPSGRGWLCTLETPAGTQRFPLGRNEWLQGEVVVDVTEYGMSGAFVGRLRTAGSAGFLPEGSFHARAYLTDTPAFFDFVVSGAEDGSPACHGVLRGGDCTLDSIAPER